MEELKKGVSVSFSSHPDLTVRFFLFLVCMCVCVCEALQGPHRDGVDVTGVSGEGLLAGPFPQVPQLGQRVAGSGDEELHVGGQSQRHAVPDVVGEDRLLLACLQVPETAERDEGQKRRQVRNSVHFEFHHWFN